MTLSDCRLFFKPCNARSMPFSNRPWFDPLIVCLILFYENSRRFLNNTGTKRVSSVEPYKLLQHSKYVMYWQLNLFYILIASMADVSAEFSKYGPLKEVKLLKGYVCFLSSCSMITRRFKCCYSPFWRDADLSFYSRDSLNLLNVIMLQKLSIVCISAIIIYQYYNISNKLCYFRNEYAHYCFSLLTHLLSMDLCFGTYIFSPSFFEKRYRLNQSSKDLSLTSICDDFLSSGTHPWSA